MGKCKDKVILYYLVNTLFKWKMVIEELCFGRGALPEVYSRFYWTKSRVARKLRKNLQKAWSNLGNLKKFESLKELEQLKWKEYCRCLGKVHESSGRFEKFKGRRREF